MDTSALVAALVGDHEHHLAARAHLRPGVPIAAIVLAETFSQLRRTFAQPARSATSLLAPWVDDPLLVLPTSAAAVHDTFARATELDLAGSIHDALIAQVHVEHGVDLITLDARQHQIALALGARSRYLLG
jgi:predicted nucleic acid-binding protein